ncbi:DegV family protein [Solihabitans fulvus]|uniref:DegV family protein n=1 Tax=Solihabitans fulvus TaxID=1892852 RepID=A0A5B2XWL8_9PSEU|nr:DegV family protein [Solihabitans fulvus]KAA2267084.1 DegV family protein [Solihabitans fulvus]
MTPRVAVVTDSTASLSPALASRWNISVVQMQIGIGTTFNDESLVTTDRLLNAMHDGTPIAQEPPTPDAFFWAYQQAWGQGADAILSLHVSSRLSTTAEAAKAAAEKLRIPVQVVDSESSGLTMGFAAVAAAKAAAAGATEAEVRAVAERRMRNARVLIYIDTLEYLHRSGRIGTVAKKFGTALSVKPLLTVNDGEVEPFSKVFGADRAVGKLVDQAVQVAGQRRVDIGVEHFAAPDRGADLLAQLRRRIPGGQEFALTQVSAAIGVNVGPGALAVTISVC